MQLARRHKLLQELCQRKVPTPQICKEPLAADPPASVDLVMIVEKIVEPNVHHEQGRNGIILQISFHEIHTDISLPRTKKHTHSSSTLPNLPAVISSMPDADSPVRQVYEFYGSDV